MMILGLDIGSNSVGSALIDSKEGILATAVSIFPAGVDESDDKRGDPKNVNRRNSRRVRITLARRSQRKQELRLVLISAGLLPDTEKGFRALLQTTVPWELRRRGLDEPLAPHDFGRVLLHLAQRRGALGLNLADPDDDAAKADDGKVKQSIGEVRTQMKARRARTFGEFIDMVRSERVTSITTKDNRPLNKRKGPREYRGAVRNKAGNYEHCADRAMIRDEFAKLWDKQKDTLPGILTDDLRRMLDDESGDSVWRHKGLLFGQRRATWDLGTLGRCVLEPTERCVPHADMYASRFLVVETVNNLKIIEKGKPIRSLTPDERETIKIYLSGPLDQIEKGKNKGQPKRSVSVTDLRNLMEWGRVSKTSPFRFNIEADPDRTINTDWFSREIVHGAITPKRWETLSADVQNGINRAILKYDPDDEQHANRLKAGVMQWAGLTEMQANVLVDAWKRRPKPDSKRLNMSRRAVRNLFEVMDRAEPWPDANHPDSYRWLTQIEARKLIAEDEAFRDVSTGKPLDDHARRRYATGTKGATARDRHYLRKHGELPPAPLISNPVVRKSIHEVRRHLIEYMKTFGRKPDQIYVELSREAKMGKKDADTLLFRNRLRNRIRNDILHTFNGDSLSSTQQRAAVARVILCVQQRGLCPLCGAAGLTERLAFTGNECEVAHIIPKSCGGHNGLGNIVLAHTKCNRDMDRRTPRDFWDTTLNGGFDKGISQVEDIYGRIERPKASEMMRAAGNSLWCCYFNKRDDQAKIERFKKDVKDAEIQGMTERQDAATKYAARQVMAYLADALYDGKGLPERGGERKIFATDGMWTSRLRREWGVFFDPHRAKSHDLGSEEVHERKEKNRGDHRHHAIDAVVIALSSRKVQMAWENREMQADRDKVNTANDAEMEDYRRRNSLTPPSPFKSRDELRKAICHAVFGTDGTERPICHRPVKRKLIGALHKATQYGPVVDKWKQNGKLHEELVEGRVTVRQEVLGGMQSDFLKPAHLRMPRPETDDEAIQRIARRLRIGKQGLPGDDALKAARKLVRSKAYTPKMVDPKPEKGGIVRDLGLRRVLRGQLATRGLDPDAYTKAELKASIDAHGPLAQKSGVPIHRVVLLWSNADPVVIRRDTHDYASGAQRKLTEPGSLRLYDSQNNHHIEIRISKTKTGKEVWSGQVVTAFEIAEQRKLAKLRAFRAAGIPLSPALRKLPKEERKKLAPRIREIEKAHPIVDRSDDDAKGGRFIMSLCEGEMLWMRHKHTGEVGYFVVAKLDKPQGIVVVPHWDARSATERKDNEGKKVPDSKREDFTIYPADLSKLAPPDHSHALKVRVSPLGVIRELRGD